MGPVDVVRTVPELRRKVAGWHAAGERVALVPTMGALHEGHLQLVRIGHRQAKRCVVSIFVNPTQFAPHEDFNRYPRDEAGDLSKLALVGCDLVWAPDKDEMYPDGFATRVVPAGAAEGLETDFRPDFFGGVATVCTQAVPAGRRRFCGLRRKGLPAALRRSDRRCATSICRWRSLPRPTVRESGRLGHVEPQPLSQP